MKRQHRSKRRRRAGSAVHAAARGTVTLATFGLSGCDDGCGTSVDPPPPPPLVCADARHGQNLVATGALEDSTLTVHMFSDDYYGGVDTVYVTDLVGAALDSLQVGSNFFELTLTLDSLSTTQVTFTLAGTFKLEAGPCDFSRHFTVTITGSNVKVAQLPRELPLGKGRDLRIELVERDGRRVRLRPVGAGSEVSVWSVTGGVFEPCQDGGIVWELPSEPGFYQVDLYVDRGENGFGFDALSFEVV